jgi:anti-sigma-K factor RskA
MNTKQYIESGILEEFVLGLLSQQEQQEVSRMADAYPEIQEEIFRLEDALENYAQANAQTPPEAAKERILAQFEAEKQAMISQEKPAAKVLSLWPKIAVAASVLLGLGMIIGLFQLQKLTTNNTELGQKVEQLSKDVSRKETLLSLYQNQGMIPVKLNGVKNQECSAQIFWDKSSKEIILHVNNLPKPAGNQQYQLWRIVDGKPVDMGVIADTFSEDEVHFKAVDKAAAFAITLEKRGGSPTPTLEAMVVMGGV